MPHDTPLISTIVAGLVLAFVFGAIANRFRMPPLVGYLVAGIAVGPFTPGFVADAELATELSELGVILLMFGVGLHFSLKDLLSVRAIAVPGAIVQIAGATVMGLGLATVLGWSIGAGLIFGLALSVASTVVLLKALQDRHLVESERGRIAVGWLIVEDIAMVLALVLIPALSGLFGGTEADLHDPFVDLIERVAGFQLNIWGILAVTLVKIAAFVGFMLVVGRRVIPWGLHMTAHSGSRELFRLAVLSIALGVAAGSSYLFGVSLALGAFFAGMILSESELSNRAAQETLPLRDAFSVLFFVAVGMLFDPRIVIEQPLPVIGTVFIILIGKSVLAFLIGVLFRQPVGTSLTISASLAQIGEFSFILAALGVGLGILPSEGRDLILAGSLISIVLNPLIFQLAETLRPRFEARQASRHPTIVVPNRVEPDLSASPAQSQPAVAPDERDDRVPTTKTGHTVLIGYGRVGSVVADGLTRQNTPFVLIEDSEKRIAAAHKEGIEVVVGNAATTESLNLAGIEAATTLIVAIPNAFEAGTAVEQSRRLNPSLQIIARAHSDEEIGYLRDLGANEVIMGEREIGLGMLGWTNGDKAHEVEVERTEANLDAVAAALRVERPAPKSGPSRELTPAIPVEELEAAIEASHPEHEPEGPAEPPAVVPSFGEMPLEPEEERAPPALVMAGEMAPHEPLIEAPVTFAEPRSDDDQEVVPDDEELPPMMPRPPVTIDAEARRIEPEAESAEPEPQPEPQPESPRGPRAHGPSSAPGVPFKPEPEPAD